MWMRAYGCLFISPLLMLSLLIFSHPPSSLSLFPSISLHIFPSAFSVHQRESPEVEDNPSSEQRVFHVLGRHAGERAASSLSSLQIPASASQPCCLSFFFFLSLPCLLLSVHVFSPMFMFSFIMEPVRSVGDVTHTATLCLDGTNTTQTPRSQYIYGCWSWTTARASAWVFCMLWMLVQSSRKEVASEEWNADPRTKQLHSGQTFVRIISIFQKKFMEWTSAAWPCALKIQPINRNYF